MEETKHTPGPWEVWYDVDDADTYCVSSKLQTSPGVPQLDCWIGRSETHIDIRKANAELIAQAPALLAKVSELTFENEQLREIRRQLNEYIEKIIKDLNQEQFKVSEQQKEVDRLKEALRQLHLEQDKHKLRHVEIVSEQSQRIQELESNIEQLSLSHSHIYDRNAQLEEALREVYAEFHDDYPISNFRLEVIAKIEALLQNDSKL